MEEVKGSNAFCVYLALCGACYRLRSAQATQERAGNQFKHGTFGSCFVMDFSHFLFLVLFNWTCRAKGACVPEDARGDEEESKEKSGRLTIPARVQLLVQLSFRWTVDDE